MEWDSDDFQLPPLIENVNLMDEDEESAEPANDIRQHEKATDDWLEDDHAYRTEKFPLPPVQNESPPTKLAASNESEGASGGDYEAEEDLTAESDDETDNIEEERLQDLGVGESLPPDVELMTVALKPDVGKPRNLLADVWVCPDCEKSFKDTKNLISDVQAYKCRLCERQNLTAYNWSLTRVILNGVPLDFSKIYNQKLEERCILYAVLALCDMMRRIRGAKRGWDEATPFDQVTMLSFFELTTGWKLDCQPALECVGGRHPHTELMLKTVVLHGVPYSSITLFDRFLLKMPGQSLSIPKRRLNVKSWFRIDHDDVEKMIRLIAHGFPLLASVPLGKCFRHVPIGEVYHTPKAEDCYTDEPKDACITHAVVLHGSAITVPECDLSQPPTLDRGSIYSKGVYFKCRNSHGSESHQSWEKKGEGADFYVWAADILGDVYGLKLHDFDD